MKILLLSSIDSGAIDRLEERHDVMCAFNGHHADLEELIQDRELLIFRSGVTVTSKLMEAAPCLRLLIRAGSGIDNVDLEYARRRNIRVVRVPGPSAQAVAEFTFAVMLSLVRKVCLADALLRKGHWPKRDLGGPLLAGKTLGIVGAGSIGSRVGELGHAWGLRALGCVRHPSAECAANLEAKGIVLTDFDTVVAHADILTLHVPLNESTFHLIDSEVLARMKTGSFLLNIARGGVVNETALYGALTEGGPLAGAALDVHEREGEGTISRFADLPNVVLTPHIGAMAVDSQRDIGLRVVELVNSVEVGPIELAARDGELVV